MENRAGRDTKKKPGNRPAVKKPTPPAGKLGRKLPAAPSLRTSFPDYNPNPVLEVKTSGKIQYVNPSAKNLFPTLLKLGEKHPFLAGWDKLVAGISPDKPCIIEREIRINRRWYRQTINYVPSLAVYRVYAADITGRKKAEEALLKTYEAMEARVKERTRKLAISNKTLIKEVEVRKLAEAAVRAEQRQFHSVLEALPCYLVLLSPDYHVPFANKFFRDRFGESHGRRCYEYLFHRTEPCEVCESFKVFKKNRPLEWEWQGPDGHDYYIYDFPFTSVSGDKLIMEVGIDVTLQKRALAELRAAHDELESRVQARTTELKELNRLLRVRVVEHRNAEERAALVAREWQSTFDSISDMVSIQDKECRLVRANKAYADAVGMDLPALPGTRCYTAVHHTECPIVNCPHVETLKTKKTVTREIFEPHLGAYLEVTTSPIFDDSGELTGSVHIAKNITERKNAEQEIQRINRELRAISDCNQAIVRAGSEQALLDEVCRILCEVVGYRMAWIGTVEHDETRSVRRISSYGDDNGYLDAAHITWADTERGQGPTGVAARTGKTDFCQDFATESRARPWRQNALSRGYRSSISIPLANGAGTIFAVLSLYSGRPNGFTPPEIELLEELAADLSFGIAVLRDKEKRREAEEQLRETRDYLDSLIKYANAPIIVWSPDFKITRFNHAFERLTGRTAAEVFGQPLDILFPESEREHAMQHVKRATSGQRMEAEEIPIRHKDGSVRTVIWNSATIYSPDGETVVSAIAQGHDITERKKVEQMKDEFIGLVSHELRTPLTVITGSLQTAKSAGLSQAEVGELIQNAVEGADQLTAILENMLELSRHQAGRLKLRVEPVSIPGTANTVIKRLKAQGVTHQFITEFPAGLPPVEADPVRVERVLYNLLENATKYAPAGSEIRVSALPEADFVVTSVMDQGPGIAPEDQSKLFELFQQLDASRRLTTGVGLGLVVCKRLVEAQGGWIKIDSAPGKGATFSFALTRNRETP